MEDGKLINAAPFDSYLLRCLRRAMMKRQINDSLCVIRIRFHSIEPGDCRDRVDRLRCPSGRGRRFERVGP